MSTSECETCVIAVGQLTSSNNKENNIQLVNKIVTKAVNQHKAEMVFLPEATDYISSTEKEKLHLAETIDGPTVQSFRRIAQAQKVWLSLGIHERINNIKECDDVKVYNTQIIINNIGEIVAKYRKLHLFNVSIPEKDLDIQESKTVTAGSEIVEPVSTPAGKVGMLICYDLRFPELSTVLRQMNASVLTYPSAFTSQTGEAHWESLLRARAIENQCYIIAAAQAGVHNSKRVSYGHSMVIDPWGKIVAECPKYYPGFVETGDITCAVIEKKLVDNVRKVMPVFLHRRNDIYKINLNNAALNLLNGDKLFANKTIPADTIFYQTKLSFAFTNIRCVVPGHVLISSKRIVPRISQLSNEEIADLFETVVKLQKVMEKIHDVTSSTLVVQDGKDAGQTVPHVHCHILPRRPGDFERNDDIYTTLASHDAEESNFPIRDQATMIKEAQDIKKVIYEMGLM